MNSEEIQSALNLAKDLANNAGLTLLEADLDLRKHHFEPENISALEFTIEAYERLGNAPKAAEYRERLEKLLQK